MTRDCAGERKGRSGSVRACTPGSVHCGVLYISNVGKGCRIFTSESQRLEGFRRYLPEQGWTLTGLVKDCNCVLPEEALDGEFALSAGADPGDDAWKRKVAEAGSGGCIARVPCAPRWWYRAWIRAAERTAWGFGSAADSREVLHFVKPLPHLADRIAGAASPGQKLAMLPVKAAGLWVSGRDDQDRIDWREQAVRAGEVLREPGALRAIVGSFPAVQNLEAAAELARQTGLPWIADFRDSVRGGWCCGPEMAPRVARVLRSASAVLYANQEIAADDVDLRAGKPFTVVENGYLDEEIDRVREAVVTTPRSGFTIRFLGTLYPTRNLDLFLAGFKQALEAAGSPEMCFEYYGPTTDAAREACGKLGLLGRCAIHGSVGRGEALAHTASATVLVLPTNTVGHPGMGGAKLYEYLGVRRPVLAAGGPDGLVESILTATRVGACCHSAEEVSRVLLDWYARWRETGRLHLDVNEPEILKYSRRGSARKLAEVLDSVRR